MKTALLALLAVLPAAAQAPGIEAIFSKVTDAKSPGLAVLILKSGRPFFEGAYGVRDLRQKVARHLEELARESLDNENVDFVSWSVSST